MQKFCSQIYKKKDIVPLGQYLSDVPAMPKQSITQACSSQLQLSHNQRMLLNRSQRTLLNRSTQSARSMVQRTQHPLECCCKRKKQQQT